MKKCQECNNTEHVEVYNVYVGIHNGDSLYKTLTLCPQHAVDMGFCPGCGAMIAGSEWDMIHGMDGLCADCTDELREDTGEFDDQWNMED
jgi:hypothetical protein